MGYESNPYHVASRHRTERATSPFRDGKHEKRSSPSGRFNGYHQQRQSWNRRGSGHRSRSPSYRRNSSPSQYSMTDRPSRARVNDSPPPSSYYFKGTAARHSNGWNIDNRRRENKSVENYDRRRTSYSDATPPPPSGGSYRRYDKGPPGEMEYKRPHPRQYLNYRSRSRTRSESLSPRRSPGRSASPYGSARTYSTSKKEFSGFHDRRRHHGGDYDREYRSPYQRESKWHTNEKRRGNSDDFNGDDSDDGWQAVWDANAKAYYFYNRFTKITQWENPRVPEDRNVANIKASACSGDSGSEGQEGDRPEAKSKSHAIIAGGYNPAIHGDYDPNADYAIEARKAEEEREKAEAQAAAQVAALYANIQCPGLPATLSRHRKFNEEETSMGLSAGERGDGGGNLASGEMSYDATMVGGYEEGNESSAYGATGTFNRFTGRWQGAAAPTADRYSDENKTKRQLNAFFDVDAAANSHNGLSLRAERAGQRLSKAQIQAFRERKKLRKEEKRRAWLRE